MAACGGGFFAVTVTLLGMALCSGVAFKAAALGDRALVSGTHGRGKHGDRDREFGLAAFLLATCGSGATSGLLPRWLVRGGIAATAERA